MGNPVDSPPPLIAIPSDFAQSLVDYLKQRPYAEVHKLIAGLLQAPRVTQITPPSEQEEQ